MCGQVYCLCPRVGGGRWILRTRERTTVDRPTTRVLEYPSLLGYRYWGTGGRPVGREGDPKGLRDRVTMDLLFLLAVGPRRRRNARSTTLPSGGRVGRGKVPLVSSSTFQGPSPLRLSTYLPSPVPVMWVSELRQSVFTTGTSDRVWDRRPLSPTLDPP